MQRIVLPLLSLALGASLISGCSGGASSSTTSNLTRLGTRVPIGTGSARSFVVHDALGNPKVVGLTISQAAFDSFTSPVATTAKKGGLGASHGGLVDENAEFVLPLPTVGNRGLIDHISLDWNPAGHPPLGVYTLPHFDVHFYTISQGQRDAITPGSASTPAPSSDQLPPGYISTVDVVPRMGVHYVDPSGPEFNGGTFEKAFIYGFFKNDLAFFEPMLTKAWLQTKPNVSLPIKQPTVVKRAGMYPTRYNVSYNEIEKQYTISLSDFVSRQVNAS